MHMSCDQVPFRDPAFLLLRKFLDHSSQVSPSRDTWERALRDTYIPIGCDLNLRVVS